MKLPSLLRLPRHKQFKYKPMYYNEAREELRSRVDAIKAEMGEETSEEYDTREARARRIHFRRPTGRQEVGVSNQRVMMIRGIIIALLFGNAFLFLLFGWSNVLKWTLIFELVVLYSWIRFSKTRKKRPKKEFSLERKESESEE